MSAQLIKKLGEMVAIDSRTSISNAQVIALVAGWLKNYPQEKQEWVNEDGVKGENLIVKIKGQSSDASLVFLCHLDTVPPNDEWETNPFILEEQGGNLYGLGACDTKGGIAALIEALSQLSQVPAFDTYFVFDGDEEQTSLGAQKFLKRMNIKNPFFIALEPTDGKVLIGQRSIIKLDITTHGIPQHSSYGTPEKNGKENATYKLLSIMKMLEEDAAILAQEKDVFLGTNTQNFGTIHAGTARNVFAGKATLQMERRLLPTRDMKEEIERIKKLVLQVDSKAEIAISGGIERGFTTPKDSAFAKEVLAICTNHISSMTFGTFQAWSEAGLTSLYGPSLILGPGSIGLAHRANEYVNAQELFHFVTIFKEIMQSTALAK